MRFELSGGGVCITASSIWTVDGHGSYRRHARNAPRHVPCLDDSLTCGTWQPYRQAWLERDVIEPESFRLGLVPEGRPVNSLGVVSGLILWTNLSLTADGGPLSDTPADPWFPPSPVPYDLDLWPGELPFTAFGQFGPGQMDLRVFDQDVYWVDRNGDAHRIAGMDARYVANVVALLTERAHEFHHATVLRSMMQSCGERLRGFASAESLLEELGVGAISLVEPEDWMEATPLMRRLRRRLDESKV